MVDITSPWVCPVREVDDGAESVITVLLSTLYTLVTFAYMSHLEPGHLMSSLRNRALLGYTGTARFQTG